MFFILKARRPTANILIQFGLSSTPYALPGVPVIIDVKVIPNAKRKDIKLEAGILKVKVVSKAERGKANQELIECLSEALGVAKGDIRIVKGEKDSRKMVSLPVDKTRLDALFNSRLV